MIAIDSPAITDGLETWKKYYKDLDNLPLKLQNDESVKNAKKRANRVIYTFEQYPNGLDVSQLSKNQFNKIITELNSMI